MCFIVFSVSFIRVIVMLFRFRIFMICLLVLLPSSSFGSETLNHVYNGNWAAARAASISAKDPLGSRVFYWLVCTKKSANIVWQPSDFYNLSQFVEQSKGWPHISKIVLMAEKAMPDTLSNEQVIEWFDKYPPRTSGGMDRYVSALIAYGDEKRAREVLRIWWGSSLLPSKDQKKMYAKYSKWLDNNAHTARMDSLLFAGYNQSAIALSQWMGGGYPLLVRARIILAKNKGGESDAIKRVPKNLQNNAGLMYERLRWRRKHNLDKGAVVILLNPPPIDKIQNPKDWWKERHIEIRRLTEKNDYKTAYRVAKDHGQKSGVSFSQGEFLSGWLALRFLHDAPLAFNHFEKLYYGVSTPVSRARAAYWAGRASRDMGRDDIADKWFKVAADVPMRFYGQLAAAELASKENKKMPDFSSPKVSQQDKNRFSADDRIKAAKMLHAAGLDKSAGDFLRAFADGSASASAYAYAADLALRMDLTYEAVAITKKAEKKGLAMGKKAWPVLRYSYSKKAYKSVDRALLHAIIRQESVFNPRAKSPSGAIGLMQVMPSTAKYTAKKYGIRYSKKALISDPSYNVAIGSRYLDYLLKRYDGSVPLAVAAYNAGPGNVDAWIKTFGDPRKSNIDSIDWIELIPVYETRNYVQRVLENRYVYKSLLK